MNMIAGLLLKAGVPQRFVKAALITISVIVLILGLSVAKCSYDRSIINAESARAVAREQEAARKADSIAADRRVIDQKRNDQEERNIRDAVNSQQPSPLSPRQRARACAILCEQSGRGTGDVPADCGPCAR